MPTWREGRPAQVTVRGEPSWSRRCRQILARRRAGRGEEAARPACLPDISRKRRLPLRIDSVPRDPRTFA